MNKKLFFLSFSITCFFVVATFVTYSRIPKTVDTIIMKHVEAKEETVLFDSTILKQSLISRSQTVCEQS